MADKKKMDKINFAELPVSQNEDVEFAEELADSADLKAQERAAQANKRAKQQ